MKRATAFLTVLLLCLGAAFSARAQQPGGRPPTPGGGPGMMPQGQVSGTVVDADTREPIATATVALWRAADSTLATGAITLEDGTFALEGLRPGRYYVQVSFVGYRTQTVSGVELRPGALQADLGAVRLAPDTAMLDEVEIAAERSFMEVSIDRTVYNTRDQLVSVGGNAANVLENIPSVEVDLDGSISLRGNQNVAVLINGRPSPMTGQALTSFLQGLPADAVERVEVIPNPSARYEPDGMAGILNIVLKQDRDLGLSGGVTLSAATDNNYNASTNLNYGKGRLGLSASYSFRHGSRNGGGWLFRENRFRDPLTFLDQDSFDERDMLSHNLNTSLDYRLSRFNTLSLSALVSSRGSDAAGLIAYTELDADELPTGRFDRRSEGEGDDFDMDYRLGFRRVLEASKHELTAEVRYNLGRGDDFDRFTQEAFLQPETAEGTLVDQQTNAREDRNSDVSLQVDYIRPLGSAKLEAGYKGSLQRMHSDFYSETFDPARGAWAPDVHLNNTFEYDQQIHAAYGILGAEFGRLGLQGGVRLEQALTAFDLLTTNESFSNDYFSVFPSAFASYKLSDARSLKLSYSKRINRPRTGGFFNQLNPFNANQDPFFRRVGNPYLQPEYVHSVEAGFTQLLGRSSLTLTPYFRRTVDVIRFIETIDNQGVTTLTFQNLDTSDSWGAEAIGTLQLGRWLNSFASVNVYRVVTDGSNVNAELSSDALGFSTRANATVNLRPGLDLQLTYFYSAPMEIENGRIAARQMADVALRQKLFRDRASLSLRASDVFGTMGFHVWREDDRFFQEMNRNFDAQQIGLTFTYNFGQPARTNRRGRGDQQRPESGPPEIDIML